MSNRLGDLCLEHVHCCAVLNHLRTHNGTIDEMNEIIDELDIIRMHMKEELK